MYVSISWLVNFVRLTGYGYSRLFTTLALTEGSRYAGVEVERPRQPVDVGNLQDIDELSDPLSYAVKVKATKLINTCFFKQ